MVTVAQSHGARTLHDVGGEDPVTCYILSCCAGLYTPTPIRLQLFCITTVTRLRNNPTLSLNIEHPLK